MKCTVQGNEFFAGVALIVVVLLFCVSASACAISGGTAEMDQTELKSIEGPVFYADLDHDGRDEKLLVDLLHIEWDNAGDEQRALQGYSSLIVTQENGTELFSEVAGLSHVGWNTLLLYEKDGRDYLLRYHPTMYQGICTYCYTLFYFDRSGEVAIEAQNEIDFATSFSTLGEAPKLDMNPEALVTFTDEINGLLEESILLVSTEDGNLRYSPDAAHPERYEEKLNWLYWKLDDEQGLFSETDSLVMKLEKYKTYIEESYRNQAT